MSYVLSHPNRPKLNQVFGQMGELARNSGFDVTVILAPTADRLQGKYFSDFPELTERPYFLDYVADLARKEKFKIINLYDTLLPWQLGDYCIFATTIIGTKMGIFLWQLHCPNSFRVGTPTAPCGGDTTWPRLFFLFAPPSPQRMPFFGRLSHGEGLGRLRRRSRVAHAGKKPSWWIGALPCEAGETPVEHYWVVLGSSALRLR